MPCLFDTEQGHLLQHARPHCIGIIVDFYADINECSSNPCLNGGACVDQVNGYICSCQAGYTGADCKSGEYNIQQINFS